MPIPFMNLVVRLVRVGEIGRARATLQQTGSLGDIKRSDVTAWGEHGEATAARAGSVAAEMLDKHPAPSNPQPLPALDELLT